MWGRRGSPSSFPLLASCHCRYSGSSPSSPPALRSLGPARFRSHCPGEAKWQQKNEKKKKPEIFELAVESRALERYDTNISQKVIEIEKKNKQVWNLKEAGFYFLRNTSWNVRENDRPLSASAVCLSVLFGCAAKS